MNACRNGDNSMPQTHGNGITGASRRQRNSWWAKHSRTASIGATACILGMAFAPLPARGGGFDGFIESNGSEQIIGDQPQSVLTPGPASGLPVEQNSAGIMDVGDPVTVSPQEVEQEGFPSAAGSDGASEEWHAPPSTSSGGSVSEEIVEPSESVFASDATGSSWDGWYPVISRPTLPAWGQTPGAINRLLGPAEPRWVTTIDLMMLWQNNISSRVLYNQALTSAPGLVGPPALNANDAQTAMALGPRIGTIFNLDNVYAIEGNYFQAGMFSGDATSLPIANPPWDMLQENNFNGQNYNPVDSAQLFTTSFIQSAELNWRRRTCTPITWIGGFRWVEWNQQMNITEYAGGQQVGFFNTATGNNLYGGQGGVDIALWNDNNGPVKVNAVGKAGVFYNNAFQRSFSDTGGLSQYSAIADQTAFFGEFGVNSSVRLTSWLSWRLGYSLFWLSGVAVPASQLSTTNQPDPNGNPNNITTINTNGSALIQGVTTGLEARF